MLNGIFLLDNYVTVFMCLRMIYFTLPYCITAMLNEWPMSDVTH